VKGTPLPFLFYLLDLSLSMAAAINIREIGGNNDGIEAYANVQLKKSTKQQNKFGIMYYLSERLYLRNADAAVINYTTWESDDEKNVYLVLNFDEDLNSHLNLIMDCMQKNTPDLPDFKRNLNGDKHCIKLSRKIERIENNMALKFVVQIYGVFAKTKTGLLIYKWKLVK
jgi:hypothetical protein